MPKMGKNHPGCHYRKMEKHVSVMVWGCIRVHGMDDLHGCEGTINGEPYI